jgi:hypothetical protein
MIRSHFIIIFLLCFICVNNSIASCSHYTDSGCNGSGNRGDHLDFSVSGTFFDPVINFTYNIENDIDLLFWTCHELCPSSFQLHWWGECQTVMDFYGNMQRVCARLVQGNQTYICAFYDPIDNGKNGLDTMPNMSPFHGTLNTSNKCSSSNCPKDDTTCQNSTYNTVISAFTSNSGAIYSHKEDCAKCNYIDPCTGLHYFGSVTPLNVSSDTRLSKAQNCQSVFNTACANPQNIKADTLIAYMGNNGQVLSQNQASTFISHFASMGASLKNTAIPLNAPLPATPGSLYGLKTNPVVCALVPNAPAPPPFCSPMPISKPQTAIIPICATNDTVAFDETATNVSMLSSCPAQSVGNALRPYYNLTAKSTILSPCETGANGLTNSYTSPSARLTFNQPYTNKCTSLGGSAIDVSAAHTCAGNIAASALQYQTSPVRVLFGTTGSDINYATSPVSSGFDPISGQTLSNNFSPIALNFANFADLSYDAATTDHSEPIKLIDPDGNSLSFLLQGVTAETSQVYGLSPGVYIMQQGEQTNFPIGQIKATKSPKPIIGACNLDKSDPDIIIGSKAWSLPKVSCQSSNTNPSLVWSVDRSASSAPQTKRIDYETSYQDSNASMIADMKSVNYTSSVPSMGGITINIALADQYGNNPVVSRTTSQSCATPEPIYGCYYYNSIANQGIGCGKKPGQDDIYLSGMEFIPDQNTTIPCDAANNKTFNPLKYVRGAKFACGTGGNDYGSVLAQYIDNKTQQVVQEGCAQDTQSKVFNDISLRIDPPFNQKLPNNPLPDVLAPVISPQGKAANANDISKYLTDVTYQASISNSPGVYLNSVKLPASISGVTQCVTCGNTRQKVPLESGFCVEVPQPTCGAYVSNYKALAKSTDADYQAQMSDGFANWTIADKQVYGTLLTGQCLPGTHTLKSGPPIRFCTLDASNNEAVLSKVVNPCMPVPPAPYWWPKQDSKDLYFNTQNPQLNDLMISAQQWQQAWVDINYGFTNGTETGLLNGKAIAFPATGFSFSASANSAIYNNKMPTNLIASLGEVPQILSPKNESIPAYLPHPYLNSCVTVPNLTVSLGGKSSAVQICIADNTYYYKYGSGDQIQIYTYNNQGVSSFCIPRGITYSDGTGSTGYPMDPYSQYGFANSPSAITQRAGPCCPSNLLPAGDGGCCLIQNDSGSGVCLKGCCAISNNPSTGMQVNQCSQEWFNGQINNTCLKSGQCTEQNMNCN